jgi:hypothetical protein
MAFPDIVGDVKDAVQTQETQTELVPRTMASSALDNALDTGAARGHWLSLRCTQR